MYWKSTNILLYWKPIQNSTTSKGIQHHSLLVQQKRELPSEPPSLEMKPHPVQSFQPIIKSRSCGCSNHMIIIISSYNHIIKSRSCGCSNHMIIIVLAMITNKVDTLASDRPELCNNSCSQAKQIQLFKFRNWQQLNLFKKPDSMQQCHGAVSAKPRLPGTNRIEF